MKNLSKISAVVLIATLSIFSQIPTSGLVCFFPFSGNYKDAMSNILLDTNYSPKLTTDRNGIPNSAYSFNGQNQAFKAQETSKLPSGNHDFTISTWVIKNNGGIPRIIASWGSDSVGKSKEVVLYSSTVDGNPYLGITNGMDSIKYAVTPISALGTWGHVAVVVKNNKVKFFLNKKPSTEFQMTFNIQNENPLGIAADCPNKFTTLNYLGGSMDDIAIYNRALSDSEVVYLYSCKSTLNSAPKITSAAITSAKIAEQYMYSVTTQDADNQAVTLTLSTKPSGMTLSSNKITWTPITAGKYPVVITAKDAVGDSITQSFEITVVATQNKAPTITSAPITNAKVGILYSYTVTATDPENDPLTFELLTKPTGMAISGNKISWTPTSLQIGKKNVKISVKDASGNSTEQSFNVAVEPTTGISHVITPHKIIPTQEVTYFLPNGKICKGQHFSKMLVVSHNVKRLIVK